jgi:hypothetical protein
MDKIVINSPNNKYQAALNYVFEIRFGPPFYSLELLNFDFHDRIFGDDHLWSSDSRFFAVQEWLTTDELEGPETQLLLIDVENERECVLSSTHQGFIKPIQFDGEKLIYTKKYIARGITSEFEIEFLSLNRWRPLRNERR